MSRVRILLAEEPGPAKFVSAVLSDYELSIVHKLDDAEQALSQGQFDLFLIGVHFDDSQSMPLISLVKNSKQYAKTPILVLRFSPSDYEQLLRQTLDTMIGLGNVSDYLEFVPVPENPQQKLREAVEKALAQKPSLH